MRRLLALVVCSALCWTSAPVLAGGGVGEGTGGSGQRPQPDASEVAGGTVEEGVINVYAADMTIRTDHVSSGSVRASGPACEYRVNDITSYSPSDVNGDGVIEEGEWTTPYRRMDDGSYVDGPGPGVEQYTIVICDGQVATRWIPSPEAVDREALIRAAVDRARAAVPAPSLDVSPPPEFGAPTQLGLWLAVTDPGQVNVVASVGSVWAGATARFESVSWDMGNGDVVECEGVGTPIVDPDTVEEGPCGYTYRRSVDVGMRRITVTGTWSVELVTSFSGPSMLEPATAQQGFDYEVYEIQAVGVPG